MWFLSKRLVSRNDFECKSLSANCGIFIEICYSKDTLLFSNHIIIVLKLNFAFEQNFTNVGVVVQKLFCYSYLTKRILTVTVGNFLQS